MSSPKQIPTSIASTAHNHDRCISSAMQTARQVCSRNGARMTSLRENVLRLIWQSHQPLGAYKLMDMLAAASTRRVAPPTVYRALDFLLEQGLIHRINSLNAFIGCTHPSTRHANNFLICTSCGIAIEFAYQGLQTSIDQTAAELGFSVDAQCIELIGHCANCQATGGAPQP